MGDLHAVEVCAGAGGQTLGLHRAGFEHDLAVELDGSAASTLATNLAELRDEPLDLVLKHVVRVGDVADDAVWDPRKFHGIDLVAGGVPCPPFSLAGRQLGATDERDLFAWAVELVDVMRPKALLLENVRGLAGTRFAGYRQAVADRLADLGYWSQWRLVHAADFDVAQLRPRFVLVALAPEYAPHFAWPAPVPTSKTVGSVLYPLMAADGWRGAESWARGADTIAPTIVGGSKRHGGADLGPTRAKEAWRRLGVDGHGIADAPPGPEHDPAHRPRLTCDMVARLQGWDDDLYAWRFTGLKTSRYRQIGNAFPPPMACAIGDALRRALRKVPRPESATPADAAVVSLTAADEHDIVYRLLRDADRHLTPAEVAARAGRPLPVAEVERRIAALRGDFVVDEVLSGDEVAFRIVEFKAFRGQQDHVRRASFAASRAKIS